MWIYIESHGGAWNIIEAYHITTELNEDNAVIVLKYKGMDDKDAEARFKVAKEFKEVKKVLTSLLSQLKQLGSYKATQELEDAIARNGTEWPAS
jgi:hypothetical protein